MRSSGPRASPSQRRFDGRWTHTSRRSETRLPNWRQPSVRILTPLRRAATTGIVADILVDTDIFIDHLRGVVELKAARHRLHYSVITRAELFAGATGTDIAARILAPLRE